MVLGAVGVVFLLGAGVYAEEEGELTDEMREAIVQDCGSIRQSLQSVQRADARTRVLLGTTYQTVLTNFVTPLNLRLVKEGKLNTELTDVQLDLIATREAFSQQFVRYSKELEELLAIDCKERPDDFYAQLGRTRQARARLSLATRAVNLVLDTHEAAVGELKAGLGQETEGDE